MIRTGPPIKTFGGDASRIPYMDVRTVRHSRMLLAGIQGTDGVFEASLE